MEVMGFLDEIIKTSKDFHATLSPTLQAFVVLFFLVLIIVIYAIFIWKLHEFMGKKNIFNFDLNKYNTSKNPVLAKLFASGFYLLEYILIIPFIVFFWFIIFALFMIVFLENSVDLSRILIISATAVAAVRMTAYLPNYGEKLATELAKFLPFTLLGVSVLNQNIFSNMTEKVGSRLSELPALISGATNYLLFIILLEIILRFFEFVFNIAGLETEENIEQDPQNQNQVKK